MHVNLSLLIFTANAIKCRQEVCVELRFGSCSRRFQHSMAAVSSAFPAFGRFLGQAAVHLKPA